MTTFLGTTEFHVWHQPPPLEMKSSEIFTVPGIQGAGAIVNIESGMPFTTRTTAYTQDTQLEITRINYRDLLGTIQDLNYEGTSFAGVYSTRYFVQSVKIIAARLIPHVVGPSFEYQPAGHIEAEWQLTPVRV